MSGAKPHSPICLYGVHLNSLTVCNILLPSVKFRMSGAVSPLPHMPSWCAQGQLHSLLHLVTLSTSCGRFATCSLVNPLRTESSTSVVPLVPTSDIHPFHGTLQSEQRIRVYNKKYTYV